MVAAHICGSCRGVDMTALGFERSEPDHCYGYSDRPALPGVLGGYRCSCPCRAWAAHVRTDDVAAQTGGPT